MKPKIGIIVCGLHDNRQFVANAYIQSVRYAGGLPFLIPLVKSSAAINDYLSFYSVEAQILHLCFLDKSL